MHSFTHTVPLHVFTPRDLTFSLILVYGWSGESLTQSPRSKDPNLTLRQSRPNYTFLVRTFIQNTQYLSNTGTGPSHPWGASLTLPDTSPLHTTFVIGVCYQTESFGFIIFPRDVQLPVPVSSTNDSKSKSYLYFSYLLNSHLDCN